MTIKDLIELYEEYREDHSNATFHAFIDWLKQKVEHEEWIDKKHDERR